MADAVDALSNRDLQAEEVEQVWDAGSDGGVHAAAGDDQSVRLHRPNDVLDPLDTSTEERP